MSWAKAPSMAVPPLPHPLVETFGRPTWREWRQRAEAVELAETGVPITASPPRSIVVVPGFLGSVDSMGSLVEWLVRAGHSVRVADLAGNCAMKEKEWAAYKAVQAQEMVALADTIKELTIFRNLSYSGWDNNRGGCE